MPPTDHPNNPANAEATPLVQNDAPKSSVGAHDSPVAAGTAVDEVLSPSSVQPSKTAATPKAVPALTTYAHFLHAAYSPTRGRRKPTRTEIKSIHAGPLPDPTQRSQLLVLAASDRTLKLTRDVMLLGITLLDGSNEEQPIREFIRDVLLRHPAFASRSIVLALEHPDRSDDKHAVRILADVNYRSLRWDRGSTLSKTQASTCRINALHCLLLWLRETLSPPLSLERIHDYLRTELWAPPAASRRTSESDRVRILIKNRDHTATDIVCSLLGERIVELQRQADASLDAALHTSGRERKAHESLEILQKNFEDIRARLDRTTDELNNERLDREIEKAHLRDDYEKLRGRLLHRLESELSLLQEGLHALRRSPPKVGVMDDHAERAIDGLRNEVDRMRRG